MPTITLNALYQTDRTAVAVLIESRKQRLVVLEDVIYQYKKFNTGDANYATQLAAYNTEVTNLLADITTLSALSLPALT
jgi:hypothetical protein